MSETIRTYETIEQNMSNSKDMSLTAFMGGKENKSSIQFNIGSEHACLSQSQCLDLIAVIAKRLNCEDGFTSTGTSSNLIVKPSGEKGIYQDCTASCLHTQE